MADETKLHVWTGLMNIFHRFKRGVANMVEISDLVHHHQRWTIWAARQAGLQFENLRIVAEINRQNFLARISGTNKQIRQIIGHGQKTASTLFLEECPAHSVSAH